ncbi:MAG TPA: arylesterase [Cyclobacteriaceae bacterium]|nr:arylesterase [Cyclobacteriaceae bacterium]
MVGKLLAIIAFAFTLLPAPPKNILFFGDSLTAGYGLSTEEAFPALLERELNKTSQQVKVTNAGLSGETSAGGLSRIDWILRQPVDIFFLELGGNDGLRGLPLDQTRKNLQAIIDKVKAKHPNVKLVLAGMMVPPNLGKEYTDEFRNIYPELAIKNKATLMPFLLEGVAGDEKLNLPDGIHPNVEGHKIVAKNLSKLIGPLVKGA